MWTHNSSAETETAEENEMKMMLNIPGGAKKHPKL